MEAKAIGRYLRVTPRKARYVLDEVRGKSVKEALGLLKFVPNEAARYIEQIVESAAANAEHNFAMDRDILRISTAFVDVGPTLKRIHPRSMGRAFRILHRTSHITVSVSEDESLKKVLVKAKAKSPARRKKVTTESAPKASAVRKSTAKSKTAVSSESTPEQTNE